MNIEHQSMTDSTSQKKTNKRKILSDWMLVGISGPTQKQTKLLSFGDNYIGKTRKATIRINSTFCSRNHCRLVVNEQEIILVDTSTNGTCVNKMVFRNSREILEVGDMIGFGTLCHNVDMSDQNCFVYRLDKRNIKEIVDLLTDDEDDNISNASISSDLSGHSSDSFHSAKSTTDTSNVCQGGEEITLVEVSTECSVPTLHMQSPNPIASDVLERINRAEMKKREIAEVVLVKPQPLKIRRKTVSGRINEESKSKENNIRKSLQPAHTNPPEMKKVMRSIKLAKIGERDREARETAKASANPNRIPVQPKVKITLMSRGEKLTAEMSKTKLN